MEDYFEKLVHATTVWTSRYCESHPEASEEELCDYITEAFANYRSYVQREKVRAATQRACKLAYRLFHTSETVDEEGWTELAVRDLLSGPPYGPLPDPVSVAAAVEEEDED